MSLGDFLLFLCVLILNVILSFNFPLAIKFMFHGNVVNLSYFTNYNYFICQNVDRCVFIKNIIISQ